MLPPGYGARAPGDGGINGSLGYLSNLVSLLERGLSNRYHTQALANVSISWLRSDY